MFSRSLRGLVAVVLLTACFAAPATAEESRSNASPRMTVLYEQSFAEGVAEGLTVLEGDYSYSLDTLFGFRTVAGPWEPPESLSPVVPAVPIDWEFQRFALFAPYAYVEVGGWSSNAFAMTATLSVHGKVNSRGRIGFGMGRKGVIGPNGNAEYGYRLHCLLEPGEGGRICELLRFAHYQPASTIAIYDGSLRLDGGEEHEILWTRDINGWMTVSIDGEQIMAAESNFFTGPFERVSLTNTAGDAAISYLKIEAAVE